MRSEEEGVQECPAWPKWRERDKRTDHKGYQNGSPDDYSRQVYQIGHSQKWPEWSTVCGNMLTEPRPRPWARIQLCRQVGRNTRYTRYTHQERQIDRQGNQSRQIDKLGRIFRLGKVSRLLLTVKQIGRIDMCNIIVRVSSF